LSSVSYNLGRHFNQFQETPLFENPVVVVIILLVFTKFASIIKLEFEYCWIHKNGIIASWTQHP
jgi:hypothetical protein